ncbi:hypothetical protein GCM10023085_74240 [Actinomadura viridis]|uniref:Uncharacterized protein n=1 Tax=Actinomadura viridis TaxID=58110 RepID=A0A931GPL9_9ACTN|nr:hypothetical protein [Actinomadura viridis]MBG6087544.1 hypothetical protein [Actinomadura viridis]
MVSAFDPRRAPVGDLGTALLILDSRLKQVREERREDPAERELIERFLRSFDLDAADDVLNGACSLIYLYMEWLRQAHEANESDVMEHVVPYVVDTLRKMPRSVRPEAIPTMSAMLTAAAIGVSPTLWRRQYGPWTEAEMNALEVTCFLLADHINRLSDDHDAATQMIARLLDAAEGEPAP